MKLNGEGNVEGHLVGGKYVDNIIKSKDKHEPNDVIGYSGKLTNIVRPIKTFHALSVMRYYEKRKSRNFL